MQEARACETLEKMFNLRGLFKWLHRTFCSKQAPVEEHVEAERVRMRSVPSLALCQNDGTVSEAILDGCESFPVEPFSDAPSQSVGGSSDQA